MNTLEIIIAVKESKPVSEQHLRLALLVLNSIDSLHKRELRNLIGAIRQGSELAKLKADLASETLDRLFDAMKKPPAEWLGPENTPGNAKYEQLYDASKKFVNAVARNLDRT